MCGIVGVMRPGRGQIPEQGMLRLMTSTLTHRGPDDEGYHLEPGVGLGFRRLSIVDLSGGHQPLTNEGESIWLVLNGEIYNHAELRPELEAKGHR
jgi:asparagine synthase (glutamine-hydrolysing)